MCFPPADSIIAGMAHVVGPNWHSVDGSVSATIGEIAPGECNVSLFSAEVPGRGDGTRAMKELRAKYRFISVSEIGDESNPNRRFWFRMADMGLVDELWDFDGRRVFPPASP